jgi:hypothetical protein
VPEAYFSSTTSTYGEERLLVDALDEPLEHHRPAGHAAQGALRDGQVVPDEVGLGEAQLGEEELVRVRDGHLGAVDVQDQGTSLVIRTRHDGHHRWRPALGQLPDADQRPVGCSSRGRP